MRRCGPVNRLPRNRTLCLLLLMLAAPPARAACSVGTGGVRFGGYDPFDSADSDAAGSVTVTCDEGIAYALSLGSGAGTRSARRMTHGAQELAYNLFVDASRVQVWGDGVGSTVTVSGVGTGAPQIVTVYGRIPARQNARVGNYSDMIVLSVDF
jgi:spore coat protein U-like protein